MFKLIDKYIGIPLVFLMGLLGRAMPDLDPSKDCRRILIIKTSALGDTILLMPVLKAIRKTFSRAKILVLATERNKDILSHCPYIDDLIIMEVRKLVNPFYLSKIIFKTRKFKPDLSIDFDQWIRLSALLSFFSGAKRKIGFKTKGQARHYLYTDFVELKSNQHKFQCFIDLVHILGAKVDNRKIDIYPGVHGEYEAGELLNKFGLSSSGLIIGIHPGCGRKGLMRAWPEEKYIDLIKMIKREYPAEIILTGSAEEYDLCKNISNNFSQGVYNSVGRISLSGLIYLLNNFKVFISSNNGIMHLAAALNVPLIALHGPTNPKGWGPLSNNAVIIKSDMECSPCLDLGFEYGCNDCRCMKLISVDTVFKEVKNSLKIK